MSWNLQLKMFVTLKCIIIWWAPSSVLFHSELDSYFPYLDLSVIFREWIIKFQRILCCLPDSITIVSLGLSSDCIRSWSSEAQSRNTKHSFFFSSTQVERRKWIGKNQELQNTYKIQGIFIFSFSFFRTVILLQHSKT